MNHNRNRLHSESLSTVRQPSKSEGDGFQRGVLSMLSSIMNDGQYLDDVWHKSVTGKGKLAKASARDKAWARRLLTTTLRYIKSVDKILGGRLKRWPKPHIVNILRLGVTDLVYLGTPDYAAVSRTMSLLKPHDPRGLVNAVLRRIAEDVTNGVLEIPAPETNVPSWLVKRWARSYGKACAQEIAVASLKEAPIDLTLRTQEPSEIQEWAQKLKGEVLPTGSLRLREAGAIAQLEGYAEGQWWVQDAAATLPVRLLGDVRGKTIADICAAPGGKTAQLAVAGAQVISVDISEKRLKRLSENMERLTLSVECVAEDALTWQPSRALDGILLDAPCSATGTIRRHPDIMHLKSQKDILALVQLQQALLEKMATFVPKGGLIVYCTCSLEPEENHERITDFLRLNPHFSRVPVHQGEIAGCDGFLTADGDIQVRSDFFQDFGGIDGFFISRLQRHE